tara:strand:- start:1264 stop:1560 length:297 start_codon:yes stop_codon:yes gene_type:complete
MLKSQILEKLNQKYKNFNSLDIENLFEIFIKKITSSLKEGRNIEIRGFGTLSRKLNKEKIVRNPKTNIKLFKNKSYKLHFKIGKTLHKRINPKNNNEF